MLERIEIEATNTTLGVVLDPVEHQIRFSGVSYPTNAITFFQPILEWVETFLLFADSHPVKICIQIEYFNTSSSTYLYRIMELFESAHKKFRNVKVHFYYEDEEDDVIESWKSLMVDLELPVQMIRVDSLNSR